jgi:3',5'-cyclic AMP phosphodiesterase CpdA
MRLLAISDLHLGHPVNRDFLPTIGSSRDDWLILAGDVGEDERHLAMAFEYLARRFARLIWVPGNHELWTTSRSPEAARGAARYEMLVQLARSFGVLTPEDPYVLWPGSDRPRPLYIVPLFTLYDYTFRPDQVPADQVLAWAALDNTVCVDEYLLYPTPYADRAAWCAARVEATEVRLQILPQDCETILINHFPLRRSHAVVPRVPRFAPWCGTRATETWPMQFRARAVVFGHLHVRRSFVEHDVSFHEVSLGYPGQWDQSRSLASYLKVIL